MTEIVRIADRDASGWERGMHVVRTASDVVVVSPTWCGDGTLERIAAPTVLLAPNHYHHLSMRRFRAAFPGARAVAGSGALPRLARQGHEGLGAVGELRLDGLRFVEAPHVRTGETMVLVSTPRGTELIVCDAFFHMTSEITGVTGMLLRALSTAPGLKVGRTYRWLATSDRARYLDWLEGLLRETRPVAAHFAHGEPLVANDLTEQLIDAARRGLG